MTARPSLHLLLLFSVACGSAAADTVDARFPRQPRDAANTFGRMFPELPPFARTSDATRNALVLFGAKDGPLDARDDLDVPNNPDHPTMPAGMTFLGQFIDHDLTFDRRSPLLQRAEPARTVNFRSPAFDLDSVYGEGPQRSPELYVFSGGDYKFRIDPIPGSPAVSRGGAQRYDLPRDAGGEALIGDSRNDENLIISQLHLAMLRFHNAVVDRVRAAPGNQGASAERVFELARRQVQWHYQWIVLNEFLPQTIGAERVQVLLRDGPRFFRTARASTDGRSDRRNERGAPPSAPKIPIEFSAAAYRFGHSQVRPGYRMNLGPDGGPTVFLSIFDDQIDPGLADPDDLRGGRRAARRFVDWPSFFDFGDGNIRQNKRIDAKLSSALMALPGSRAASPGLPTDGVQSLASRNLIRHVNFGLPSGQAVAARIGVPALSAAQLAEFAAYGWAESTPLWAYILKEAEVMEEGTRLGPVGARIVGEVFVGLLQADADAYLVAEPRWRPTLPSAGGPGSFRMTDLLRFAGVVPTLP